jgi:hypothetical protein
MVKEKPVTYTCEGSVRGCCGVKHRYIGSAVRCIKKDMNGCASQGGYSDRNVVRSDGKDLSEYEIQDMDQY